MCEEKNIRILDLIDMMLDGYLHILLYPGKKS